MRIATKFLDFWLPQSWLLRTPLIILYSFALLLAYVGVSTDQPGMAITFLLLTVFLHWGLMKARRIANGLLEKLREGRISRETASIDSEASELAQVVDGIPNDTLEDETTHPKTSKLRSVLKYAAFCVAGLVCIFVVAAILAPTPSPTFTPTREADASIPTESIGTYQPLTTEEIAKVLQHAVVRIDTRIRIKGLGPNATHEIFGSGVIYLRTNGLCWILSNSHVVGIDSVLKRNSRDTVLDYSLQITLPDGQQVVPKMVQINKFMKDFAVIVVPDPGGPYLALLPSATSPAQGQKVYAMGHPKGLNNTFSSGVVSALREITTPLGRPCKLIQTDTTINSGNSGGPLVDESCVIVGINTFVMFRNENAQGLNFAISTADIVRSILDDEMVALPLEPGKIGPFLRAL